MKNIKTFCVLATSLILAGATSLVSCSTDDVKPITEQKRDLYEIKDRAFGEYLLFNCSRTDDEALPYGTAIEQDGKIYIDKEVAAKATNLYLVKNDTQVKKLQNGGVQTAAVKIASLDGIQFFTSLKTLKITSNAVSEMNLTKCTEIETIEMNNNAMKQLDLSQNTKLVRFRFGANASDDESLKLSEISFENCSAIQHIYLKNQNIGKDGLTLPKDYSHLTEIDMSGNPGADFEVPEDLYNKLTIKNGVKVAGSGTTDPDPGKDPDPKPDPDPDPDPEPEPTTYEIKDAAFGEYLYYECANAAAANKLPEGLVTMDGDKYILDLKLAATVEVINVAKTKNNITKLTNANLETAATPIASADGLQYFTALKEFTATSNQFNEPLPLATLVNLEVLQINTAYVGSLDLSANTKLKTLNCNGSAKADEQHKIAEIDLSHNLELETISLESNLLQTIDVSMLTKLTSLKLGKNPGADFTIPAAIFNNLKTKSGVVSE